MKTSWILLALGVVTIGAGARAREIGFVEDFSLADDRGAALKQLIPGTEDFYYYTCLQAQNSGALDQVRAAADPWIKRYGYTPRVKEILNRQALLEYSKDPRKSLDYIRKELGLTFDHRREVADRPTDFPTRLDPAAIDATNLQRTAFSRYQNLQGVEDEGLDGLPFAQLDPARRRDLLGRLQRPDIPGLPQLVVDDLRYEHSGGFGSLGIHGALLANQLQDCLGLMPELIDNVAFINATIAKLAPSDDVDVRFDPAERRAYIERLVAFTRKLAPAHNSLKVHALYQLLDLDRHAGIHNPDLFLEYIKLPRRAGYVNPEYLRQVQGQAAVADVRANFEAITRFAPVPGDDDLVRDYLANAFLTATNTQAFAATIRDDYLRDVFVETKIVNGLGDMEQWASLLTPARFQALKDRIDLDFAVSNREFFAADEAVALDLYTKNVGTLIVKVFEINAFNYYRSKLEEISSALDLDGLVASDEQVVTYKDPPLRRVRRPFAFPQCAKPGVYVVEFIGNGRSSRALIRKGQLQAVEKLGAAGHEFTVLDEAGKARPAATLWLAGREFKPDAKGVIVVPFSTEPGPATAIVKDGDLCSLARFTHRAEEYQLSAGFYVDREALLKGTKAHVMVRPRLTVAGRPASLALLQNVRLSVESRDGQGITTVKDVPDFALAEDRESLYEFQVPDNLASMRFVLKARVRNISRTRDDEVSDSQDYAVNGVDRTEAVDDLHFRRTDGGYWLELLGKNGEPKAGRPVHVELKHRAFRDTVHAALQTDAAGRIELGRLPDIAWVRAGVGGRGTHTWEPGRDEVSVADTVQGQAGATVRIPVVDTGADLWRQVALLEKRGSTYVANRLDAVRLRDGFLELSGLPAGDYALFLKAVRPAPVTVRLTGGTSTAGCVVSERRTLELGNTAPVQMTGVQVGGDAITVTLANVTPFTRLHVLATRFMPAHSAFGSFDVPQLDPYEQGHVRPGSQYIAGRDIGDEYRYVLDRKYAPKYAGVMLGRPGLLLNPWSINKTETALQQAQQGELQRGFAGAPATMAAYGGGLNTSGGAPEPTDNLDFLAGPTTLLANLRPDAKGVVTIERKALGVHPFVRLVAVDPLSAAARDVALADTPAAPRDLRLVKALDSTRHFTEQKAVVPVAAGGTLAIGDLATSELTLYDSLDKAFNLLATLGTNATLREFEFVLRWPGLPPSGKQTLYSKYACHELNFFLYKKDRAFFDAVILPYLKHKKDKTFMDQWLVGGDVSAWSQPAAYARLNVVEQILLGQRGVVPAEGVGRAVGDLGDLLQPDADDFNRRFDTGLRTGVLDTGDALGYAGAKDRVLTEEKEAHAINGLEVATAAAVPMAPAPMAADKPQMVLRGARALNMAAVNALADAEALPQEQAKMLASDELAGGRNRSTFARKSAALKRAEFFDDRKAERESVAAFFRKLDSTEEYAENNYYHLPVEAQGAELVTVNAFWSDYARHDGKAPFLSRNLLQASRTFTEAMLALAVLDLPFQAAEHKTAQQGASFSVTPGSALLAFCQEIKEGAAAADKPPILVSQDFFRYDDRYRFVGNERYDKFVTDEFLVQTVYGCRVVLVNPTSSRQDLRLLLQIPQGALPVLNGFMTRGIPVALEPYATRTVEYAFYFPATGQFPLYPVQVAQNERFVAGAAPLTLNVVAKLSRVDTESWDYVSQNATPDEVLAYLRTHNLNRLDLAKIAWRMTDKAWFEKAMALLAERHVWNDTLGSYALVHNVPAVAREFLQRSDFANRCGLFIDTPLLTLDPVARGTYQHLEYKPLVNARIHPLGKRRQILNDRLFAQYERFMTVLSFHPALTQDDLLGVTYYLLLQDRVDEALRFFKRVTPSAPGERLAYDYLHVYLDFCQGEVDAARKVAERYRDYPVPRWRDLFADALGQLDEVSGKAASVANRDDRDQVQGQAASTAPGLDFKVEARQIAIEAQNLDVCRVNLYPMDIELLFSRNPFVQQQTDQFAFVRPAESLEVKVPDRKGRVTVDLPKKFHSSNVMVEVVGGGLRKVQAYYANSLAVQVTEPYGQVQVANETTHKPLARVYVKVYARMKDGSVKFYKDGYTDMRGRFDYASLSTNEGDNVERYSILVLSDDAGAVIREAAPPKA